MFIASLAFALGWVIQASNTSSSLRGLSVVSSQVVWASGTGGAVLRTVDSGSHWIATVVPGAASLDFRDIEAIDDLTAYVMSSGEGTNSRVYKTIDAGQHWTLLFTNPDAKGFFDAIAFWDRNNGILMGDPVDEHFSVFTTVDGGGSWSRQNAPASLPNEALFAASGTCLIVSGSKDAYFGTGGLNGARVFHSTDRGQSWNWTETPLRASETTSGIFSLAFSDLLNGIAVGGDYTHPESPQQTAAFTSNGGKTWTIPSTPPHGYRSGVIAFKTRTGTTALAVGTNGSDISLDRGQTWQSIPSPPLNAVAASSKGENVWAVGPHGVIARLLPDSPKTERHRP